MIGGILEKAEIDDAAQRIRKGEILLHYVIQVASGMEEKVEEQIGILVGRESCDRCFHPIRHVKKKIRGEWRELREKLLPGYVFIVSNDIEKLYLRLRYVSAFTKLLGRDGGQFVPLPEDEVEWLMKITGSSGNNVEAEISWISVSEDDAVTILSGPLKDMEGCIKKIDLHRRIAKVEVDFMNRKTVIHLGIEMIEKKEEKK